MRNERATLAIYVYEVIIYKLCNVATTESLEPNDWMRRLAVALTVPLRLQLADGAAPKKTGTLAQAKL